MKRVLAAAAALGAAVVAVPAVEAQLRFCGPAERSCARLSVPLDRSGRVPGDLLLHVERHRPRKATLPPLFLLAGGPGQGASPVFLQDSLRQQLRPALRRRDLIVFDQRGTGRSEVLRCRPLERADLADAGDAAGRCAELLGERRAFYATRDSVEDIEAVREAIGAEQIALFGISYGTKTALAYALAHPDRVERLVLDSVVDPAGPDPLYRDSFEAVPRVLGALCQSRCRKFSRNPARDVRRLVGRMARRPLRGLVYDGHGRGRRHSVGGFDLFSLLLAGDFGLAELRVDTPAAVSSALRGDPAPLLRLARRAKVLEDPGVDPRSFSPTAYAATVCEEAQLPWARTAPFEARPGAAASYAASLPAGAFRPFDAKTALDNDFLRLCERWPAAAEEPALGPGPLPDVPVLLLEGEQDLRTPVEGAQRVAGLFPRAHLLVAPDTGHDPFDSDITACAQRSVARFLSGREPLRKCRHRDFLRPTRPLPRSLRRLDPLPDEAGRPGRTLRAARATLEDVVVEAGFTMLVRLSRLFEDPDTSGFDIFAALLKPLGAGGLRGGWARLSLLEERLVLHRVQLVPGVRVSGELRSVFSRVRGELRLTGRTAARGRVRLVGRRIVMGRLGGRSVFARWRLFAGPSAGFAVEQARATAVARSRW